MRKINTRHTLNPWPGFVDAFSALLVVILFALLIFSVALTFLGRSLQGKEQFLRQEQDLIQTLRRIVRQQKADLEQAQLHNQAQKEKQRFLEEQLMQLNNALAQSHSTTQNQQIQIETLNQKLVEALKRHNQELEGYRSEFFFKLRQALGQREDVRIVGDRFVFQSEVLFAAGSDRLEVQGRQTLLHLARSLKEISQKLPADLAWILRVDGHTDIRPIHNTKFSSNWALSAARAIAVVQFLIQQGIPPQHLAAAGFGPFQPLEAQQNPQALSRNRRIEFKLDQR